MRRPLRCLLTILVTLTGLGAGDLPAQSAPGGAQVTRTNPGPWGDLEYWEIWLEPPTSLLMASGYLEESATWRIPPGPPTQQRDYLASGGLTEAEIDQIFAEGRLFASPDTVEIEPPAALVESLTAETRSRLYDLLGEWPGNRFMQKPFSLGSDTVRSLADAAHHRIPENVIDYANRLIYRREPQWVLSDYPLVMRQLPDPESRIEMTKVLMRSRSLMVRLKITPASDLGQLRDYWSARRRNWDILPILDSVAQTKEVDYLDLVHLLPPLPRQLLYAYARPSMAVGNDFPDCYWTAFNFLESEASNRNLDFPVGRLIGTRWLEVAPPLSFGDLVLVERISDGEPLHACSYLADDLVYSKNGLSLLRPFIIEEMGAALDGYLEPGGARVRYFRHRDLMERAD